MEKGASQCIRVKCGSKEAEFYPQKCRESGKTIANCVKYNGNILDIIMYVDDVVLISSSAAGLRKHITTLSDFSQRRKLEVNTEKTKICVFGGDRNSKYFH